MAKGDDLEDRLIDFSVRIIKLCEAIPKSPSSSHIRGQLLRSGTAPAPNYGEARSAESDKDFVHELKIALKEMNEARIWIKVMLRAGMMSEGKLRAILNECEQLCRILSASVNTVKERFK